MSRIPISDEETARRTQAWKDSLCDDHAVLQKTTDLLQLQTAVIQEQQKEIGELRRRVESLERILRPEPVSRGGTRRMIVTAYTAADWPDNPAYGITASGHRLSNADAWRVAAADPRYYPSGTRVFVAGVGMVTVRDTGADVRGPDRLDIFVGMENRAEAFEWGRRAVPARILGRVES